MQSNKQVDEAPKAERRPMYCTFKPLFAQVHSLADVMRSNALTVEARRSLVEVYPTH